MSVRIDIARRDRGIVEHRDARFAAIALAANRVDLLRNRALDLAEYLRKVRQRFPQRAFGAANRLGQVLDDEWHDVSPFD
jgi:hypothetical protein